MDAFSQSQTYEQHIITYPVLHINHYIMYNNNNIISVHPIIIIICKTPPCHLLFLKNIYTVLNKCLMSNSYYMCL